MSPTRLVSVLRQLRPEDHAPAPDYARRVRLEWRILRALERGERLRPLDGRPWTRAQLLEEALGEPLPTTSREPSGFVIVVDARDETAEGPSTNRRAMCARGGAPAGNQPNREPSDPDGRNC